MTSPDRKALWTTGPRTRLDKMRRGDRFLSSDGEIWTYVRQDGALSGVHHVINDDGKKSCFAGCAEGALTYRAGAGRTPLAGELARIVGREQRAERERRRPT